MEALNFLNEIIQKGTQHLFATMKHEDIKTKKHGGGQKRGFYSHFNVQNSHFMSIL